MSRPSSDNTTSSHNTSNTQKAVFNYAQAARKSSPTSAQASANGNQASTPPVNGGVKQQQQQPQASSFAAALQKSSNPSSPQMSAAASGTAAPVAASPTTRNRSSVQLPRAPSSSGGSPIQFGSINHTPAPSPNRSTDAAVTPEPASQPTAQPPVPNTQRRDSVQSDHSQSSKDLQVPSPHQQPQQPYQQRHAHYQNRHHNNSYNKHAGVNHSPNMQHSQPFAPHHQKKPMSPHVQSAPSPSMSAAQSMPMNQQWSASQIPNQFYVPQYEQHAYYHQPYAGMPIPAFPNMNVQAQQGGRSPSQPFIHSTPQRSKAIPIINPETMAQVKTESSSTSTVSSRKDASPVIPKAEEKKEKIDVKPAGSPSRAIKIVDPAIKEREEREKREKEEADQLAQEEAEKKAQEEKSRKEREEQEAKEKAEREAREKAEKEEADRVEHERLEAEKKEQERLAAEQKAREEEEQRISKEREEKERLEKEEADKKAAADEEARLGKEREEKERLDEAQKAAEVEAVAAAAATAPAPAPAQATQEAEAKATETEAKAADDKQEADKKQEEERIAAITATKSARGPGRLDLTAIPPHVAQAMPTPVTTEPPKSKVPSLVSRTVEPTEVNYPEGFQAPATTSKPGIRQYDVAFLMQFAMLCSDTAEDLSAFEGVGIDEQNDRGSRPGMQRRQTSERGRGPRTPGSPMGKDGKFEMGKFAGGRSLAPRQGSGSHSLPAPGSPGGMQRDGSHGGRSRSGRGGKGRHPPREQVGGPTIPLDQVVPLEKSEHRWVPTTLVEPEKAKAAPGEDIIPEDVVVRKIKSLLNKLTLEKFDSISTQILSYANQSVKESDGKTLRVVIQLVFEKATDESQFAQMWAQLCRKMLDSISNDIRDENVKDGKTGQYVTGSNLFRKYLLNRCQEDFERGWKAKLPDMPEADSGVLSEEYYAAVKAKRQGLGLIRLIGELFKLQMLTERIMHECIKKLLSNVSDPEEEETESLCKLMTTVGKDLDHPKAKGWMDIYFERIKELQANPKLSSRIRFMIQDVIELRKSKWTIRPGQGPAGPATIAQIHEEAARAREREEKEAMKRTPSSRGNPMARASSHRGKEMQRENSSSSVGPDGWSTVGNASPTGPARKAGDLANFGKIERSKSRNGVLGPGSSPFASLSAANRQGSKAGEKKVPTDEKVAGSPSADSSIGTANMFSALGGEGHDDSAPTERRKLQLLPRGTTGGETVSSPVSQTPTEAPADAPAAEAPKMSGDEAKRKIKNMLDEFYGIKDKNELYECIKDLGSNEFHPQLVQQAMGVVEQKVEDIELTKDAFAGIKERDLISKEDWKKGLDLFMEIYEDLRIDVPLAPKYVPQLITAAGFDPKEFMEE